MGFAEVGERKGPRFRYRDADGIIHGPMSLEMLEELLGSRVPEALERVSIDGAEWVEIEERPEVSGIRAGAGEPSEPDAQEADPALGARQRGTTYDWEDQLRRHQRCSGERRRTSPVQTKSAAARKAVSTGEYRDSCVARAEISGATTWWRRASRLRQRADDDPQARPARTESGKTATGLALRGPS